MITNQLLFDLLDGMMVARSSLFTCFHDVATSIHSTCHYLLYTLYVLAFACLALMHLLYLLPKHGQDAFDEELALK